VSFGAGEGEMGSWSLSKGLSGIDIMAVYRTRRDDWVQKQQHRRDPFYAACPDQNLISMKYD
jgi:hypothetical protein